MVYCLTHLKPGVSGDDLDLFLGTLTEVGEVLFIPCYFYYFRIEFIESPILAVARIARHCPNSEADDRNGFWCPASLERLDDIAEGPFRIVMGNGNTLAICIGELLAMDRIAMYQTVHSQARCRTDSIGAEEITAGIQGSSQRLRGNCACDRNGAEGKR